MTAGTQPIAGIVPKGPGPSLLTVAGRFPAGTNWSSGISFRQTHCFAGGFWALCPAGDDEKPEPDGGGTASFYPFTGLVPAGCDWVLQENAEARFDPENRDQLEAASAWFMSRELWTGATNADNQYASPSLQAPEPGETDEFPAANIISGPLGPVEAIGRLLAAYHEGTKVGGAVLHIPDALIPSLLTDGTISVNGQVLGVGGLASVSPGPGYPSGAGTFGPKTAGSPNGLAAAADQVWMFISGPVEAEMGPITREPDNPEARWFNRRTNQYYVVAERQMIYRFDPCAVWAVLVDVPTEA